MTTINLGSRDSILTGMLVDQSALHGLLGKSGT